MMDVRRMAVVGCPGSGKSTLAVALGRCLGIPVHHLDQIWWREGWVETTPAAFEEAVAPLLEEDRWILDGNYSFAFQQRFARADAVVWLDLPRPICMARVLARTMRHLGRTRSDLPPGCEERFDAAILKHIWTYRRNRVPLIRAALANAKPDLTVIHLRSRGEVAAFLARLEPTGHAGRRPRP